MCACGTRRLLKLSFWCLNIGLAMMTFLSLLPQGMWQTYASASSGLCLRPLCRIHAKPDHACPGLDAGAWRHSLQRRRRRVCVVHVSGVHGQPGGGPCGRIDQTGDARSDLMICRNPSVMSPLVQVFGRRDDEPSTRSGGRRPKSAKARNRGRWCTAGRCRGRYGDLATGSGLRGWIEAVAAIGLLRSMVVVRRGERASCA